ncbi:uncharacterized protein LTR77_006997 [Saxophila tyrrhenica]|uniref:Uncharacterized protein n=1 Tax=Saxophila tyrrhenica TaxID=1690608 RepID=A0AAV9P6D7_9PEZI|nr:hypothetical protein LTR77_006997 [Saxophila tyrrhenica]
MFDAIRKRHEAFLLPYIDQQSLSEDPRRLLALMYHRSQNEASDWVLSDLQHFQISFKQGRLLTAYNPHSVIMFGERLGELVQWEIRANHHQDQLGYPCALLVLEAQFRLSDILRKMVDFLLQRHIQNAPKPPEGNDRWEALAKPGFQSGESYIGRSRYYEQPFSAPPKFDAEHIARSCRTMRQEADDELLSVQTDPLALRDAISNSGSLPKFFKPEDLLNPMPSQPHMCEPVVRAVSRVQSTSRSIRDGTALPLQYGGELMRAEASLWVVYDSLREELRVLLRHSPAFEGHYEVVFKEDDWFHTDRIFWTLANLAHVIGAKSSDLHRPAAFYFDQLDRLMTSGSDKNRNRVEERLYNHIADMAAVDELFSAIKFHRSRRCLAGVEAAGKICSSLRSAQVTQVVTRALRMCINSAEAANAFAKFVQLPLPPDRASETTVPRMRALHKNLEAYWSAMSTYMRKNLHPLPDPSDARLEFVERAMLAYPVKDFATPRTAYDRRRKVTEPDAVPKTALMPETPSLKRSATAPPPDAPRSPPSPKQPKVKTRPAAEDEPVPAAEPEAEPEEDAEENAGSKIAVSSTSLALFARMFSRFDRAGGRVRWNDFVAALTDEGCRAEPRHGYIVAFSNGRASVNFHKPHPDPTIRPSLLRQYGERLQKWFEWDEEMFVERGRGQ